MKPGGRTDPARIILSLALLLCVFCVGGTVPAAAQTTPPASMGAGAALTVGAPPAADANAFAQFMKDKRGEKDPYLKQRFERMQAMTRNKDLVGPKEISAFLLTPREEFCRSKNLGRAYEHAFLDIGFGVTISGPYIVGRMTSAVDVQPGDKVLEIGTGSGYQAAILSNLTDKVYTIEIIEPLAQETDKLYEALATKGYAEYKNILRKADDGYYGWAEHAPFDKIIVTCGIDHIPPDLLAQLKPGGVMCIPVGSPGSQVLLKVTKKMGADGNLEIVREDVYQGRLKVQFVPFTKKGGGTHYQ